MKKYYPEQLCFIFADEHAPHGQINMFEMANEDDGLLKKYVLPLPKQVAEKMLERQPVRVMTGKL